MFTSVCCFVYNTCPFCIYKAFAGNTLVTWGLIMTIEKILEITSKYPINQITDTLVGMGETHDVPVANCENHLDDDFMRLLEDKVHLDITKFPL